MPEDWFSHNEAILSILFMHICFSSCLSLVVRKPVIGVSSKTQIGLPRYKDYLESCIKETFLYKCDPRFAPYI